MRALISVADRSGLVEFAASLRELGVEIVADEATRTHLADHDVDVLAIASLPQASSAARGALALLQPAVIDRVLHCADRDGGFDIVAVNLPALADEFSVAHEETSRLALIDTGRPAVLRAAAVNYPDVTVLSDPDDYEDVLAELFRYKATKEKTRRSLAAKAMSRLAAYDAFATALLEGEQGEHFPASFSVPLFKQQDLRYGENLHQRAALYTDMPPSKTLNPRPSVATARQLHGKELSFNNFLDLDAAWAMVTDFAAPTAAIVKHTNPTGIAAGKDLRDAFAKALAADPAAAYDGIVGMNRTVDAETASEIVKMYFEAVIAPDFAPEAIQILSRKKAIRLLSVRGEQGPTQEVGWIPYAALDFKRIDGGFLLQTRNVASDPSASMQVVSKRQPTLEELTDLHFAWRAVRHVKSNGVVLAKKLALVGVGAGQMSRVFAVDLACRMAGDRARGSVLASDAYFPFPDSVERAAEAGVTAIMQPGGSIRDNEAIEAADKAGMAMIFTGLRHFKH